MTAPPHNPNLPTRVGLIGIGLVGSVMAEHFLRLGIEVIGYDIDDDRLAFLRQIGGCCATGPREIAQTVDCIVLSLPDTDVVRDVIEGSAGILHASDTPSYVIDTTTGDPDETIRLAEVLAQSGIAFLDATICGASCQLQQRKALLMVGGDERAYQACAGVLDLLAEHVFYLGLSGSGSKAKLATNLVLGLNRLVLAEGMVFAERLGLPLGTFLQLLKVSPAYSGAVDVKGQKMLAGDFEPVSRIHQHHKDISLMLKHAQSQDQDLPLARLHLEILEKTMAAGDGDLDPCAVIKEIRRRRHKELSASKNREDRP